MGRTCRACSQAKSVACAKHRTLNRYFHPEHTPESQGYQIWFYARFGLVAQWTRARGYELRCRGFESLLARVATVFVCAKHTHNLADVAELVDARDLGSRVFS